MCVFVCGGGRSKTGGAVGKVDVRSAYTAVAGGGAGVRAGGAPAREDLAKLSVTEFAKLVKEVCCVWWLRGVCCVWWLRGGAKVYSFMPMTLCDVIYSSFECV